MQQFVTTDALLQMGNKAMRLGDTDQALLTYKTYLKCIEKVQTMKKDFDKSEKREFEKIDI